MPDRFSPRILAHLSDRRYEPRKLHELARDLGIVPDHFNLFRRSVAELVEEGHVVLSSTDEVVLPPPGPEMTGTFRKHERGFGFVVPDSLVEHGDLFVPPGGSGDALTGDHVRARVIREPRRRSAAGRSPYIGRVVEIIQRADRRYVGTLDKRGGLWVVHVDGRVLHDPVLIRDPHAKGASEGDKVVVELVDYPEDNSPAAGVITEVLGEKGEPEVETLAVMRARGLPDSFPERVLADARAAARQFDDDEIPADREDLTDVFVCTIDPPDARDFDDAISIRRLDADERGGGAAYELGVHIADVSHFVKPGGALDEEAKARGNSTYLPRRVVPMLPELLSNGVCSLQEQVHRLAKSAFVRYDADGNVLGQRFARTVIRSAKRLTYLEAQHLIDGDVKGAVKHAAGDAKYPPPLTQSLQLMDELARRIRRRRLEAGMIVLGLPEVELLYDDSGRVTDAQPEDGAFTHTIIEMFMVEANEAAARLFDSLDVPMIRRIHPDPGAHDVAELRQFARVAGYNIPSQPTRKELQALLDAVRGKPTQHAVHLAVLRTLSKAEYGPLLIGHFALASEHYTHFTSPIRRYPDLIVHRGLEAYCSAVRGQAAQRQGGKSKRRGSNKQLGRALRDDPRVPDEQALTELGRHCSATERNSEAAERDLRAYLLLELLAQRLGEDFDGIVTGVTSAGAFVQIDRFLVDGFVRSEDLPAPSGERWKINRATGALVAQGSGRQIHIGHRFVVRIAKVDPSARLLDLVIVDELRPGQRSTETKTKKTRRQPQGAREAHQQTMKIKQKKKSDRRQSRRKR